MNTTHHAGRTIRESRGLAGARIFEVTSVDHTFSLQGSAYGSPGPVVMIVGQMQEFVSAPHRFGDTFDVNYIKRWIDTEDEARATMVSPDSPMAIVCTTCNAGPGKSCSQPTENGRRTVAWFHAAREDGLTWT